MFKRIKEYRELKKLELQSKAIVFGTLAEFIQNNSDYILLAKRLAEVSTNEEFMTTLQKEVVPTLVSLIKGKEE